MTLFRFTSLLQIGLLASLLIALRDLNTSAAFSIQNRSSGLAAAAINAGSMIQIGDKDKGRPSTTPLQMGSGFMDDSTETAHKDGNGVEFTEGVIVQLTADTKCYQAPRKAMGTYTDDGTFVPLDWEKEGGVQRVERCCVLPKGTRAMVSRVYDISEFDASQPIVAKFQAGNAHDGVVEPPATFFMHFESHEIEVVA